MERMAMAVAVVGMGLGLVLGTAQAQAQPQVWKCEVDGQVRYTDQPCEKNGQPLPPRALQPNGPDGTPAAASGAAPATAASAESSLAASQVASPVASPVAAAPQLSASDAAVDRHADAVQMPPPASRAHRAMRAPRVAMWGLMDTDFVQRGRPYRRQNPAFTPNP
jgi:hypothetical protein